jgi:cell division protein FtsL
MMKKPITQKRLNNEWQKFFLLILLLLSAIGVWWMASHNYEQNFDESFSEIQ